MGNPNYPADEASRNFVSFEAGDNLDKVLARLFQMQRDGQTLKGSTKEFSPRELAELVMAAGNAIQKYMGRLDVTVNSAVLSGMVEINNITRTGNLRQAVIDSLVKAWMKNDGLASVRGRQIYLSLTEQGPFSKDKQQA